MASNCHPPDLSHPDGQEYRREPPAPALPEERGILFESGSIQVPQRSDVLDRTRTLVLPVLSLPVLLVDITEPSVQVQLVTKCH
jgi:hypothetical protein